MAGLFALGIDQLRCTVDALYLGGGCCRNKDTHHLRQPGMGQNKNVLPFKPQGGQLELLLAHKQGISGPHVKETTSPAQIS
ncbi:hypothetical protein CEXT_102141 [Caerostris extrusa]|uniref:Uncharacterized protein n=1 Tax=Caerostris extrusa TaxID=172846 RepID=A0AAV4SZ48_CAEEX|nr:hypothetical protein CEXT_102141 [Caerostris extrusa]